MSVIENFLVNTGNFDSIIQTLINDKDVPSKITDTYFKSLGFQNPSDLLVIHLLKGLNILEEDGSINERFNELRDPSTTQIAIAKGVVEAYEGLFRMEPLIHKMQHEEIQSIFSEVFAGQKSELIFKYMANTFNTLVTYAGGANIEMALNASEESDENSDQRQVQESVETGQEFAATPESSTSTNGVHQNGTESSSYVNGQNGLNGHADYSEPAANSESSEPKGSTLDEEESNISFEDLVGLNSSSSSESENTREIIPNGHSARRENNKEDASSDANHQTPPENTGTGNASTHSPAIGLNSLDSAEDDPFSHSSLPPDDLDMDVNNSNDNSLQHQHGISSGNPTTPSEGPARIKNDKKLQHALIKKADLLYKLERYENLLPTLDQIIAYFDRANEPFLKEAVSIAVIRRAFVLYNLKKYDQALPALDRVINRFSYSDSKKLYEQASLAMLYKAKILEKSNRPEQVLPLFDSIIERLGHTENPELKSQVDDICLKRLDMLSATGREDEVLVATDQLIERFRHDSEKLQYLEEAMFKKAEILENLNKYEEALDAYSYFLEKFGQTNSVS